MLWRGRGHLGCTQRWPPKVLMQSSPWLQLCCFPAHSFTSVVVTWGEWGCPHCTPLPVGAPCPAPWVLTLTGIAVSMEQVPRGAEAAVGAREVEAVMEANLCLGAGLVELAFIHI